MNLKSCLNSNTWERHCGVFNVLELLSFTVVDISFYLPEHANVIDVFCNYDFMLSLHLRHLKFNDNQRQILMKTKYSSFPYFLILIIM